VTAPARYDVEARSYELDPYGHLNNAVYVNWLEQGRLCCLRARGHTYDSIPAEFGVHIVVVQQDLTYKAQVRLGDRLTVTSRIVRLGETSFTFEQSVEFADGTRACEAAVTMVCVGQSGRPEPVPPPLREILSR